MYSRYSFYKRNGVYYVRFRDKEGKRLPGLSTGETIEKRARRFADDYLQSGCLDKKEADSFALYTKDFFDYEKSSYIQNEIRCNRSYGRRYAEDNERITKNILTPVWKDKSLSKITVSEIEALLFSLLDQYSPSRVCAIRNVIACIFGEAFRTNRILMNPMDKVSKITSPEIEKGVYDDSTIHALFDDHALTQIWKGNFLQYAINYLAFSTGMRQGELLALMPENITNDHVFVKYSWEQGYGLKEPKYKSNRCVPITQKAYFLLRSLIENNNIENGQYVFSSSDKSKPIDHRSINRRLSEALARTGMSDEERRSKKLTFHSWRHVFTSKLRNKIPENQLKLLTGHKTDRMVNHYSHYDFGAVKAVMPLQEELFGAVI